MQDINLGDYVEKRGDIGRVIWVGEKLKVGVRCLDYAIRVEWIIVPSDRLDNLTTPEFVRSWFGSTVKKVEREYAASFLLNPHIRNIDNVGAAKV
jgi:hypothetical protein